MSDAIKPCERCGRRITFNASRKQPIRVCRDCKSADPEYLRLRGVA